MARAFALDVLKCPSCGGRMRLIATIIEKETVEAILNAVGLPADSPVKAPSRLYAQQEFWDTP
jgi:hypothetical protein